MFKKKKELTRIKELIKDRYLIGVDLSEGYLELRAYEEETNKIISDFFDINDDKIISWLHEKRRTDSFKMFKTNYNELYINQKEGNELAVMEFDKVDNRYQIYYNVSTNLVRKKEEMEFISSFLDLYLQDRKIYTINGTKDIYEFIKGFDIINQCEIVALDKENYAKKINIYGKLLCKELVPGIKELKEIENIGRRVI